LNHFLPKNGSKGDNMVNEETTTNTDEFDIFSEPVPELSDDDVKAARTVDSKAWILSYMGEENIGRFGMIDGLGFALQCVEPEVMRCILCYDDSPAIKSLAMVKQTIESVGGRLEIGDFTVLKEYVEPEENDSDNLTKEEVSVGMEVA
tara:strand:- start:651 stop:1094 length:444 start_codon:yes stop_codon:yes gene_type:complete